MKYFITNYYDSIQDEIINYDHKMEINIEELKQIKKEAIGYISLCVDEITDKYIVFSLIDC